MDISDDQVKRLIDTVEDVKERTIRIEANQKTDHDWTHSINADVTELKGFMNRAKGVLAIVTIALGGLWALILKFWKSMP